jgi:hypothetical protein
MAYTTKLPVLTKKLLLVKDEISGAIPFTLPWQSVPSILAFSTCLTLLGIFERYLLSAHSIPPTGSGLFDSLYVYDPITQVSKYLYQ